jgi:hypothetical protein
MIRRHFVGALAVAVLQVACGNGAQPSTFGTQATSGQATSSGAGGQAGQSTTSGIAGALTATTGNAAGAGINPTGGVGGAGGQGGGGIDNADAACAAERRDSQGVPVDLFFMVDKSTSMYCPVGPGDMCLNGVPQPPGTATRWTAVTDALKAFVSSPSTEGIGAGIGFFPVAGAAPGSTALCAATDYVAPAVAIGPLPGAAMPIVTAIGNQMLSPGTPTTPALQGALEYAKGYATATPNRSAAVVLTTDGQPSLCAPNSIETASAAATAALAGTPSIKTYVIGVGPSLDNLNQIAVAGGTSQAYLVDTGMDVVAQLTAALKTIANPITCDYAIPMTPGKPLDFGLVDVEISVGSAGVPVRVGKVADAGACTTTGGWYYDMNPPATPTMIKLCPQSCDPIRATAGSTLKVLIGCAPVVPPPPR